ncbi:HPr family phosphocarrier protein [Alkaliphilus crotonatoxidans]
MKKRSVLIRSQSGLHARPASILVNLTQQFQSSITFEKGGKRVNGKSLMGILSMAVGDREELTIIAEGSDELEAIDAIEALLTKGLEK